MNFTFEHLAYDEALNDGNPVTATTTFPSLAGQDVVAATEILGNALRLYGDARLLFDHERYATCASLSVLAIEELAKFMALAGFQPLQRSEWRRHPAKHLSPASFLLRNRYQAALREVIAERQLSEPSAVFKRLAAMEYRPEEMMLFDAVLAKITADGSLALAHFSRAYGKETDRLKQLGFYVDVDDKNQVRTTPTQITREIAEDHLYLCRDILKTIQSHMPMDRDITVE
jgi:AbiV family abortive infection protein